MPSTDRVPRRGLNHDPEAMRWALEKSGLTQLALAEAVGCSRSLMSELLAGTRSAGSARLRQIAKALNCPVVVLEAKREYVEAS